MVKRTITYTTIFLILTMVVSLIIVLNKSSFAADDDIASGTSGTCSWVIDSNGVLTISPTDGVSGTLASYYSSPQWCEYNNSINKVVIDGDVKTNSGCVSLFRNLTNCTEMDLSTLDTSNATNMMSMFYYCEKLTSLDLSNFNTSNVTDMSYMFNITSSLTQLNISNFDTQNVTNMSCMFFGSDVNSLDLRHFDTSKVTNMSYMFHYCDQLTFLDISSFDTSNVTDMSYLFYACTKLTVADVSGFNTSKVTDMSYMFCFCEKLPIIDVSGFDTSKVTTMYRMFCMCKTVANLDVSNFVTDKVTDMEYMFLQCYNITELDVSNFNTANVTTMANMFCECKKLSHIDVSNFNTGKVTTMFAMFDGCKALRTLDLSNFNTSKVKNMVRMFEDLNLNFLDISSFNTSNTDSMLIMFDRSRIESIKFGKDFKFKGKNIEREEYQANIPNPPTAYPYTGKWIREDGLFGPYTSNEMKENYVGEEMYGIWIWETTNVQRYSVSYAYSGFVPEEASELPEDELYELGENVVVCEDATAPGYTFSGWSRTGTFEMPEEDVEITGSFTANTDTPYKVEHYLENLNSDTYTLAKTDNLTGTTDTEITATAKAFNGFTFDDTVDETKLSGTIAGDESLVLKLYYKRNSYNVTYSYTGDVPDDVSDLPSDENYKYGAEITVPEEATAEGYTFSGWIKDYITMPAHDITITGYFIDNSKSYNYKVEYFFDGELDESLDEILNAEENEEISITPQTPVKHGNKNYTLVSKNHKITISINDEDNIIEVYYETDVLDYAIDNFEDVFEGDGIPDKYQIQIIYKVENGKWDDGTKETKIEIVTLKDTEGNLSEEGTGSLNVPIVGNKPAEGYTKGSWNEEIPKEVSGNDDGREFIYSYAKITKTDIAEPEVNSSNPKTSDVFHRYLINCALGIIALMIVIRIRRKYSRKAKKIQY